VTKLYKVQHALCKHMLDFVLLRLAYLVTFEWCYCHR